MLKGKNALTAGAVVIVSIFLCATAQAWETTVRDKEGDGRGHFISQMLFACSLSQLMVKPPFSPKERNPHYFLSRDRLRLYYKKFVPKKEIRGIVIVTAGIGGIREGDYNKLGEFLSGEGFALYILHPRGTGYSEGKRGDISDFDLLLKDFRDFVRKIEEKHPKKPLFLFGHSLGGAIAIQLGADLGREIAGIILINPAYRYSKGSGPSSWTYIYYAFNYIFRPSALTVDMKGDPRKIRHPEDRKEAIARAKDPLIVKKFSMRYLAGARKIMEKSAESAKLIKKPLLLIYGAQDEIIDHSGSEEIFKNWKCSNKKKVILKEGGHGIHTVNMSLTIIGKWLKDTSL